MNQYSVHTKTNSMKNEEFLYVVKCLVHYLGPTKGMDVAKEYIQGSIQQRRRIISNMGIWLSQYYDEGLANARTLLENHIHQR